MVAMPEQVPTGGWMQASSCDELSELTTEGPPGQMQLATCLSLQHDSASLKG